MDDAQVNRLHRKVRILTKENGDLKTQITRLEEKSSGSDGKMNQLEGLVEELTERGRVTELEKDRLNAQVEKIKGDLAEALGRIQDLKLAQAIRTPAGSTFLQTTELLEAVLAHLPGRRVLLAQRVCSTWRDIVQASPVLQKKLWLKEIHSAVLHDVANMDILQKATLIVRSDGRKSLGPMPAEQFHTSFIRSEYPDWQCWADKSTSTVWRDPIHVNPHVHALFRKRWLDICIGVDPDHLQTLKQGSWQAMYFTSPRVKKLYITVDVCFVDRDYRGGAEDVHDICVRDEGGITMGGFVAALQALMGQLAGVRALQVVLCENGQWFYSSDDC